jgi:DNA primase
LAVVVEGYTDVIALAEAGRPLAVATCGTALGESHLDLLRRFTERVVLMFDADEAGVEASLRGFERSVPGDLDLRVALLPPGRDPADVASAGEMEVLAAAIRDSVPLLQFRIDKEMERYDLSEPEARGRAVRAVAALVARHPDAVTRHEYSVEVARRTGVALEVVAGAVESAARQAAPETPAAPVAAVDRLSGEEKAERELLRLMLANHAGVHTAGVSEDLFTRPEHRAAYRLLAPVVAALDPGTPPDLGALLASREAEDLSAMLAALAMADRPLPEDPSEVVGRLQAWALDRRIEALRRRVGEAERGPGEAPSALLEELIGLERRRRDLRSPQ